MWSKDGGSEQEFNRDKYECVQQARTSWAAGGGEWAGLYIAIAKNNAEKQSAELFKMCMEARGYTGKEADEDEIKSQKVQAEQKDIIQREKNAKAAELRKKNDEKNTIKKEEDKLARQEHYKIKYKSTIDSLKNDTLEGDSIIWDHQNKLMWANDGTNRPEITWNDAVSFVSGYKFAGYSDWRLPTIDELYWAYLYLNKFNKINMSQYWSSIHGSSEYYIKSLNMANEDIVQFHKTNSLYVLPVRDIK